MPAAEEILHRLARRHQAPPAPCAETIRRAQAHGMQRPLRRAVAQHEQEALPPMEGETPAHPAPASPVDGLYHAQSLPSRCAPVNWSVSI
jgi:hypothetical protein